MKKLQKAALTAVAVAVGITLALLLKGEEFSLLKTGLYAVVAFAVDFIFTCFFEKRKTTASKNQD